MSKRTNAGMGQVFLQAHRAMEILVPDSELAESTKLLAKQYHRLAEGFDEPEPPFTSVVSIIEEVLEVLNFEPQYFELVSELNDMLPSE
jgi:hypothetical protein